MRLECNPEDPSKDLYLGNEIMRIAAAGSSQGNERDRPTNYADAGIWRDAVSALALLQFNAPDDAAVRTDWETLLDGLEMSEFKTARVLQIF